jgi:hypothetical protein
VTLASYLFGIVAALMTLFIVIEMLRRRRLRERHAIYWLIFGILALIIGIFPQVLVWAAGVVGVAIPTNLVFFVSIIVLFFVCIQHSSELTTLETKTRILAEDLALQEIRLRELEAALRLREADATPPAPESDGGAGRGGPRTDGNGFLQENDHVKDEAARRPDRESHDSLRLDL